MSKHTPGPWSLDLGNIGIDMKNHVAVDAPSHGGIANVVWVMEEDADMGKNSPQCEANARLIAAAPDMLETLKRLREMCADFGAKTACDMADAAIFKATGEQA